MHPLDLQRTCCYLFELAGSLWDGRVDVRGRQRRASILTASIGRARTDSKIQAGGPFSRMSARNLSQPARRSLYHQRQCTLCKHSKLSSISSSYTHAEEVEEAEKDVCVILG
jgi:hypothetical protein